MADELGKTRVRRIINSLPSPTNQTIDEPPKEVASQIYVARLRHEQPGEMNRENSVAQTRIVNRPRRATRPGAASELDNRTDISPRIRAVIRALQ